MKRLNFSLLISFILTISIFASNDDFNFDKADDVTAVPFVDLKRYTGQWYEIARYSNKFQKQCVGNVTANYSLKDNGDFEVLNKCLKKDGQYDDAKGKAKIVDKATNAKLKVSFFLFFYAPYWILDLDPNYEYALVGTPDRKYLWILSRTPKMNDATFQNILRKAEKMGFEPNKLVKTPQNVETLKGEVLMKPQN